MDGILMAFQGALSQGILWGVMVLGVYITFKLLDIADLTVDGSFALGGCVCAVMIVNYNMDPIAALLMATLSGVLAGAVTGILHTVFDIPAILAGILTQISLWSVNLRIMGKSNIPLLQTGTVFIGFSEMTGIEQSESALIIGLLVAACMVLLLYWFFGTEVGSALRATGNNENMVRALGVDTKFMKLIGLMISNGLVGLSGGLVCQSQKYADINMGTGAIVIGLAAIVIGEVLMGRLTSFYSKLIAAVAGSAVYFLIRAVVLQLGMNANDMKMLSAVIVAIALAVPVMSAKISQSRGYDPEGKEKG
jgi:putative ABC transport system permease protein